MEEGHFFVLYSEEKKLFLQKYFGYTQNISNARKFSTYSEAKRARHFLSKFYLTSNLDVRMIPAKA